ncbi:hypothetical protein D3C76_1075840 [compost metagenome]
MTGYRTKQFAQLKTFSFVDLVAEVVGRQLVGFIDDDQIPICILELELIVLIAR